jgi:hypothetical protein
MSELEHYGDDLRAVDREILRAALVAGIDLNDDRMLRELIEGPFVHSAAAQATPRLRATERLRGLLILRTHLEVEMMRDMAAGMPPHG